MAMDGDVVSAKMKLTCTMTSTRAETWLSYTQSLGPRTLHVLQSNDYPKSRKAHRFVQAPFHDRICSKTGEMYLCMRRHARCTGKHGPRNSDLLKSPRALVEYT